MKHKITDNTELFYGKLVQEDKLIEALESGKDLIIDRQNLSRFESLIDSYNYIVIEEGYNLTSYNDLYQFCCVKSDKLCK